MTENDRQMVLEKVRELMSDNHPIVISHGTDTMVETGLYLQRALSDLSAPVILTGAMRPLGFEGSDGLQNLTESLFAARVLGPRVFVVIHNQAFLTNRVLKDQSMSRFVAV